MCVACGWLLAILKVVTDGKVQVLRGLMNQIPGSPILSKGFKKHASIMNNTMSSYMYGIMSWLLLYNYRSSETIRC